MATIRTISFDGIVIGGGGAGMRAALQLAQSGYKTAVITKYSQLAHIPYLLKAALPVLSRVLIHKTIGAGICMTP